MTKINMKARYFWWCFALCALAQAQITIPANSGGLCNVPSGTATCNAPTTATANIQIGDTIIAILGGGTASVPTLSGTCNITWPTPIANQAGGMKLTIWIVPHVVAASTGCNVTVAGLSGANGLAWQIYRGVGSIGTQSIGTTNQTASTNFVASPITAADIGNYIVGVFGTSGAAGATTAVGNTTIRRAQTSTGSAIIADLTATSVGQSLQPNVTTTNSFSYMRGTIELVASPTNRTAQPNDAMRSVVMNATKDMNYVLPTTGLSPTWCTWFMPIDTHNHDIEPQSSGQVNGQTTPIDAPAWQMTRICQDANGHFWTSPPLLAGAGISITGSATGVTISAGMSYIAGGTQTLPGTVQVAANNCATLATTTAANVLQTDVVSDTLQPGAATTGWASVRLYPVARDGSVEWRACNSDTTAYTPVQRDVNWYVLRRTVTPTASPVARHHRVVHHKPVVRPKK